MRVLITAETFTLSSNIIMDTSTFLLRYAAPALLSQAAAATPPGAVCLLYVLKPLSEPFCTLGGDPP